MRKVQQKLFKTRATFINFPNTFTPRMNRVTLIQEFLWAVHKYVTSACIEVSCASCNPPLTQR